MIKVFYEDENIAISTYGDTLHHSFIDEKRPFGAYSNIIGRININGNDLIIENFHIEAMGEKYSEILNSVKVAVESFGYEQKKFDPDVLLLGDRRYYTKNKIERS